jgi:proteasome beta subunit
VEVPQATTILSLKYRDGVVVAGDRRAVEGFAVSARDIEKVFPADSHSAIAIAGAAGPSLEVVRLFQTELEHYEKLENTALSLEGKSNRLGQIIRANFPAAMQGLVVLPLFAGYDLRRGEGRIFRYDVTGGRYEEAEFHADGSGGRDARAVLRRLWRPGLTREEAVRVALEALLDAAEVDLGTGGPDLLRGIYPVVATVEATGYRRVPDDEVGAVVRAILEEKRKGAS